MGCGNFFASRSKKISQKQNGSPKNFFCDLKRCIREPLIDFSRLIVTGQQSPFLEAVPASDDALPKADTGILRHTTAYLLCEQNLLYRTIRMRRDKHGKFFPFSFRNDGKVIVYTPSP